MAIEPKRSARKGPGRPPDPERRARRRREILAAAIRFFAERGYPGTDVQHLADAIGIGKGTVYRYFNTKQELFRAALDAELERYRTFVLETAGRETDPLRQLSSAFRASLSFFEANPDLVELLVQERALLAETGGRSAFYEHRDRYITPWHWLFRALIAEGRLRDVPVERTIDVLSDLLYGFAFTSRFSGDGRERWTDDVLDLLLCGILSESERAGGHRGS